MSMPPRMTAGQLFWWGVGLLAGSIVLQWMLVPLYPQVNPSVVVTNVVSTIISTAGALGVALVAASLVVVALAGDVRDREAGTLRGDRSGGGEG
ncbi:hypothetical protein PU560_17640 [Georgenia sp. 10Sc9-8]|uniref:Uncharacterized protein n=1 Tax=Georgenia halotolerans TaxID=3028317 RepID=A0ABT5U4C2_9MICO|nr:hypothetical protein [Georgenia halotolerans]